MDKNGTSIIPQQKALNPYVATTIIFLAFIIMTILCYFALTAFQRKHLIKHSRAEMANLQKNIRRDFNEPVILLIAGAEYMRSILTGNEDRDEVERHVRNISGRIVENNHYKFSAFGLFGYYERFGGAFVDSEIWEPGPDYRPKERAWYKAAIAADGEVAVSDFFYDASTKDLVISYSILIYDDERVPLMVLSMNVPIGKIAEGVVGIKFTPNGYGFMTDGNFNIIAHPDESYLGKPIKETNYGNAFQNKIMREGGSVSEYGVKNSVGNFIAFVERLENGWYMGILTPREEYYREITTISKFILFFGFIIAAILSFVVYKIFAKKREADNYAKTMFDSMPLACCLWDRTYHIIACNQKVLDLFEIESKEDYQRNYFDFSPNFQPNGRASLDMILEVLEDVFENGTEHRIEWMNQDKKGNPLPSEVIVKRLEYNNQYFVAEYTYDLRTLKEKEMKILEVEKCNLEERRKVEIATASNKAKSKFLAAMSHEIRTPMNAIIGITEIQLQNDKLPVDVKEAISRIYNSADLLLGIINDILDLSKIDAGKMEIVPDRYEVASLICDTVNLNMMRSSKPIKFGLCIDENVPSALIGDELRIKQILNNLLSNAFKFTNKGEIQLSVYAEKQPQNSNDDEILLFLCVSDTGEGMAEQEIGKFFSEYSRSDNRLIEGTGLGLTITRDLVDMMNGNISVKSTAGQGSIFTICLPQKIADAKILGKEVAANLQRFRFNGITRKKAAQVNREYMPYGKVLVVDDVETNLYVAEGLLLPYGLHIETAASGFEAVEKIKEGKTYDVIFMDHMMPKMDGIEAVGIIRGFGYNRTIIALTANAVSGQSAMFLSKGFDAFISKPIDIRQLNAALNKYVRDKQPKEVIEEARIQREMKIIESERSTQHSERQLAKFFERDAQKAIKVMENVLANIENMPDDDLDTGEDLRLFAITAHAMKGALSNIGENELSEKALVLEKAGKAKDKVTILSNTQELIDDIKQLIEDINAEQDESAPSASSDDTEYLHEKLQIIRSASIEYDEKTTSAAISDLKEKSWTRETQKHIDEIFNYLLHSDFEDAAELAGKLLEKES